MKITFSRTGNVYLNVGIVGIAVALDNFQIWQAYSEPMIQDLPDHDWGWDDDTNALWVETDEPKELFERLYNLMGREYYNTSTKDALNKHTNFYYIPAKDKFKSFPKMKTYGFGALLTNDASGKTTNPANTIRKKTIKEDDQFGQLIKRRFEEQFAEKGMKLENQLYVREPYAKITRLELNNDDFKHGKYTCPVTGESFGRLHKAINVSPTASGISNFMPQLSTKWNKIGWKALYAVRFAPVLALYRSTGVKEKLKLYCYFYDHPHLETLYELYMDLRSELYLSPTEKQEVNHSNNIKLKELDLGGSKGAKVKSNDFVHSNEVLFQLVYSLSDAFYRGKTNSSGVQDTIRENSINLYMIRSDAFDKTIRPKTFTAFNHFNYVRRYIRSAEEYGINWGHVLASLRYSLPKKEDNRWVKERLPREAVLKKLIHGKSFLEELKNIFYEGYSNRITNKDSGFKRWNQLALLIKFNHFGPLNNYSPMEKTFHEKAYALGTHIGQAIINDEETGSSPSERTKFGRKYIIDLDKSRTYEDLLEALKRIQLRYKTFLTKDLIIDPLMEENFRTVKLLATIAALNSINGKIFSSNQKNENPV